MAEDETKAILSGLVDLAVLVDEVKSAVAALRAEVAELREEVQGVRDDVLASLERLRGRMR
jgi:hypothetical protein